MSRDEDREAQHLREVLEQAKRASSSDERDDLLLDDELLAARPSRKPKRHRIKDEE